MTSTFVGTYEAVVDKLRAAESVSIVSHLRPDADAVGSAAGLAAALKKMGKKVSAFVGQNAPISENLLTIPGAESVRPAREFTGEDELIVTVDCGSLDRTGVLAGQLAERVDDLVVIDHHASNEGFGAVNLVARAESTTTVLRTVIEMLGVELDEEIAHALYAGLMSDTGSFRWGTPKMHRLAAELMEYGIDTRQIAVDLLDNTTADDLQMMGRVLSGLQIRRVGNHTAGILIADVEAISGHSESAIEKIIDFVRALEGTDIGVVFKEQKEAQWATSLRSSVLDVSKIAARLGGGGHIPAAGYTTYGPREAVVTEFLDVLRHTS